MPTGVPGLDLILRGGLFRGGVYMLLAPPGSGKTILGNQIAFHHVASGGRVVYVTLLTESHARLFASIQHFAFFDAARGRRGAQVPHWLPGASSRRTLKGLLARPEADRPASTRPPSW